MQIQGKARFRYPYPMSVRAIRGAIQVEENSSAAIQEAVLELLPEILRANQISSDSVISVFLTCTPDLNAEFPAAFAREIGFENVPLICGVEMAVPGSLPLVLRVMLHVESPVSKTEIKHIYLRGASVLRKDLAQ
jgi:chorismate mutase